MTVDVREALASRTRSTPAAWLPETAKPKPAPAAAPRGARKPDVQRGDEPLSSRRWLQMSFDQIRARHGYETVLGDLGRAVDMLLRSDAYRAARERADREGGLMPVAWQTGEALPLPDATLLLPDNWGELTPQQLFEELERRCY